MPGLSEYGNRCIFEKFENLITFIVSLKSKSVSPGNPIIMSVEIEGFLNLSLIKFTESRKFVCVYFLLMDFKIESLPLCNAK